MSHDIIISNVTSFKNESKFLRNHFGGKKRNKL